MNEYQDVAPQVIVCLSCPTNVSRDVAKTSTNPEHPPATPPWETVDVSTCEVEATSVAILGSRGLSHRIRRASPIRNPMPVLWAEPRNHTRSAVARRWAPGESGAG